MSSDSFPVLVVDYEAKRGYDNVGHRNTVLNKRIAAGPRYCDHSGCNLKLSIYNTTKWCAKHQRENIHISTFI